MDQSKVIDIRSDTVTHPTPDMVRVMATAEVGDDAYREDPTINALEEEAAQIAGKEASLFVTSGTMANQIAVRLHTRPGDELIADASSHIYNFESGGTAAISGVQCRPVHTEEGLLSAKEIEEAIQSPILPRARTGLICIENTHNRGGGAIYSMDTLHVIKKLSDKRSIPLHMDGARVFNASVASDVPVAEIARNADTISFCLSKGLGAPFGSLIAGPKSLIEEARRVRQMLGGGMRQAGIFAAAGLYAMKNHVERLAEDHAKAKILAKGIATIPNVDLPFGVTPTNIVVFDIAKSGRRAKELSEALKKQGVLVSMLGGTRFRALTHLDVSEKEIKEAIIAIESCLST